MTSMDETVRAHSVLALGKRRQEVSQGDKKFMGEGRSKGGVGRKFRSIKDSLCFIVYLSIAWGT